MLEFLFYSLWIGYTVVSFSFVSLLVSFYFWARYERRKARKKLLEFMGAVDNGCPDDPW
jgi:hypothetical protein